MAIPTAADIGFPVRTHWAAETGPARPLVNVNTFVVHDTEGFFANDEPYLAAATPPVASCHALIAPNGELVFMVPLELTAWTPGNDDVAERSINVEMSGFQSKGYTDAQYKSMAAFYRWCVAQDCPIPATYVGKSGTAGIIGHQDVPNPYEAGKFGGASGHTDPGPLFDWNKFVILCKGGSSVFDPCMDYFNAHGGEAVFGKPIGGQYGTNGSIERMFTFAHLYVDKASGKVIAEMKDRTNPLNKNIGPGVYGVLQSEGMFALTNEDYYVAEGNKPGLPKRSFTYAQDKDGVTYRIEAIQDFDSSGKPADTWTRQIWKFEKEIK